MRLNWSSVPIAVVGSLTAGEMAFSAVSTLCKLRIPLAAAVHLILAVISMFVKIAAIPGASRRTGRVVFARRCSRRRQAGLEVTVVIVEA